DQLDREGVVQVLRSDLRGDQAPVLAAVGPMQFEVVVDRLRREFQTEVSLDLLDYHLALQVDAAGADVVNSQPGAEVLTRTDGTRLAVFVDRWRMQRIARENPELVLEPLAAGAA
ncbi:MAG: peptide chain release factor 3, partial [Aeromicrobium sp.]